jgi:hypothetical protein
VPVLLEMAEEREDVLDTGIADGEAGDPTSVFSATRP